MGVCCDDIWGNPINLPIAGLSHPVGGRGSGLVLQMAAVHVCAISAYATLAVIGFIGE